jgi:hypothetical protein
LDDVPTSTIVELTVPSSSGIMALTSDFDDYVPYTGATTNLNLGTHSVITPNVVSPTQTLNLYCTDASDTPLTVNLGSDDFNIAALSTIRGGEGGPQPSNFTLYAPTSSTGASVEFIASQYLSESLGGIKYTNLGSHKASVSYTVRNAASGPIALYEYLNVDISQFKATFQLQVNMADALIMESIAPNLIVATDSASGIVGLSTSTYPSLTELSYVKGATSNLQTQINSLTGDSFVWNDTTSTTQTISPNNGYVSHSATQTVFTLPSTAAFGTRFSIVYLAPSAGQLLQNAGQIIIAGDTQTTIGTDGRIENINLGEVLTILCTAANTEFTVISPVGNFDVV